MNVCMGKSVLRGYSLLGEEAVYALGFVVAAGAVNSIRLELQMLVLTLELGKPDLLRETGLLPRGGVAEGRG